MIEFNSQNIRSWSIMGINTSVCRIAMEEIIAENDNISVLTADLSRFSGLKKISAKNPDKVYNVGIAEQNMIGVAAGMAMEGMQAYVTTYAPFVTFRCADQVRHLMGNMNLNIKAIGSSAGLTSGWSGVALQAINDIAFMRSIPNMMVLSPADCTEAIKMMLAVSKTDSPAYIRLCGTTPIPNVYKEDYDFEIGKAVKLRQGEKVALVATGVTMVSEAVKAAKLLEERLGINCTVVNIHTIKPIDEECIKELAATHNLIVSIEEHNILGGLGSAMAEVICRTKHSCRQIFIGIDDMNYKMGKRQYMLEQAGLTAEAIFKRVNMELEASDD